ncbi:MAG: hypothetical protein HY517_00350 [Candidatus Aenigmarchaeota archaeon]|nr:hypothetical protein [Candidatus Aenigmarchaeota archaeon]
MIDMKLAIRNALIGGLVGGYIVAAASGISGYYTAHKTNTELYKIEKSFDRISADLTETDAIVDRAIADIRYIGEEARRQNKSSR